MSDFRDVYGMRTFRQFSSSPAKEANEGNRGVSHDSPLAQVLNGRSASEPAVKHFAEEEAKKAPQPKPEEDTGSPAFTVVEISDSGFGFAGDWRPTMATPTYIGDNSVLLNYLYSQERKHRVTMPIKACGIDPIAFDYADVLLNESEEGNEETGGENVPKLYTVPGVEPSDDGQLVAYELIEVDGQLYMSCVTQSLDEDYLVSVLSEATISIKETGKYCYQLINYRKLALEPGQSECRLLRTLRLNTFEMSILMTYMNTFENMKVSFRSVDGKQCIMFSVK